MEALRAQLEGVGKEKGQLQERLEGFELETADKLQSLRVELEGRISELQGEVSSRAQENAHLALSLEGERSAHAVTQGKLEELETERNSLKKKADSLAKDLKAALMQQQAMPMPFMQVYPEAMPQSAVDRDREKIKFLQLEKEALEDELKKTISAYELALESQLMASRQEMDAIMEATKMGFSVNIVELSENATLQKLTESLSSMVRDKDEELFYARAANTMLASQVKDLKIKLQKLQRATGTVDVDMDETPTAEGHPKPRFPSDDGGSELGLEEAGSTGWRKFAHGRKRGEKSFHYEGLEEAAAAAGPNSWGDGSAPAMNSSLSL
eukprot:GILI01021449.1.p1 GENE.GILI01021449.1~~GILI01021449.1.p1  ORF type:complete len:326 (-),score=97.76 GILI01021449.1:138-1115(-)